MLSPQDIQTMEFAKAVFGGYDMASVDDFLEQVTEDYSALYKDNAVLKGKIKVLVEKVEEYRSTEDAMRMALLTAQKMSDELLAETKKKCDQMLADAARDVDESRAKAAEGLSHEDTKLEAAKAKTASFVSASRQIVGQYVEFLDKLESVTAEYGGVKETGSQAAEPVFSPEPEPAPAQPVPETPAPPVLDDPLSAAPLDPDAGTRRIDSDAVRQVYSGDGETKRLAWDEEDELTTPRPKFNFSNLKFGSNYSDGDSD